MKFIIHVFQWSNLFSEPSILNNVRTSRLFGLEITSIINAFLFTGSYEKFVKGEGWTHGRLYYPPVTLLEQ